MYICILISVWRYNRKDQMYIYCTDTLCMNILLIFSSIHYRKTTIHCLKHCRLKLDSVYMLFNFLIKK